MTTSTESCSVCPLTGTEQQQLITHHTHTHTAPYLMPSALILYAPKNLRTSAAWACEHTSTLVMYVCMHVAPYSTPYDSAYQHVGHVCLHACCALYARFMTNVRTSTFYKFVCMRLGPCGTFCDGRACQHVLCICLHASWALYARLATNVHTSTF